MGLMKFSESTLIAVIAPYLWTFSLFAVVMPPYYILRAVPTNRHWILYIIRIVFVLYMLAQFVISFWVTYTYNVLLSGFLMRNSLDIMTCVLSIGINIVQLVVQITVYVQALTKHNLLRDVLNDIVQLESDIRKHLRTDFPLASFRWRLGLRVGIWFVVVSTFVPYLSYMLYTQYFNPIKRGIIVFFGTIIHFKGVEYCISVQTIQELLQLVQQQLVHLRRELVRCERVELRFSLYDDLQTNQKLLARVWNLLNQIERYFFIPMLMLFFINGFAIIQAIHWAYINFERDNLNLRLYRIIYTVMIILALLIPCYLSQCCIDEYNRFGTILHKLKTMGIDEQLNMRLQEYSLQLMHQKMLFTCGGFFDINLKNFGAISLTITTYIVILIQFKLQAETEKKSNIGIRFE
ncbi:putative gustatory receptor 98b [Bactrocera neohumeralis]|uniref:putative gustatory receptor 98b n=1 Tax=Bactrocera tryoni TaxID=59916 RepID=UPI001A95657B|nr:putative gustatory receptor 98b [Bactrocera tryoni]XP_039966560.1 putative gustatory receptor 98b [Bactrocera tryoni]XP_050317247.1 putative gustatory receptor 98b [Bactrocera neohumeralis]XP_050318077.1 putative gustatory receptor 98b [Bactrocera neohumeralis]